MVDHIAHLANSGISLAVVAVDFPAIFIDAGSIVASHSCRYAGDEHALASGGIFVVLGGDVALRTERVIGFAVETVGQRASFDLAVGEVGAEVVRDGCVVDAGVIGCIQVVAGRGVAGRAGRVAGSTAEAIGHRAGVDGAHGQVGAETGEDV